MLRKGKRHGPGHIHNDGVVHHNHEKSILVNCNSDIADAFLLYCFLIILLYNANRLQWNGFCRLAS